MSSEDKAKCFTVTWKIENFIRNLSENDLYIWSPVWKTKTIEGSESWWRLIGVVSYCSGQQVFKLDRLNGEDNDNLYEMALITSDGEFPISSKSYPGYPAYGSIDNRLILGRKRESFLSKDTLTFCCRIKQTTIEPGKCVLRTVLHQVSFLWNIEGFSYNNNIEKKKVHQHEKLLLYAQLCKIKENSCKVSVDFLPNTGIFSDILNCEISIENDIGRVSPYFLNSSWDFDIEFHSGSSPKNTFWLEIQCIVATDMEYQQLTAHYFDTLTDDLLKLYKEKMYSDATLNSEGKAFPVHRGILAARSPVFRAMFDKKEMSEGRSGVVDIDDVDSETVDRMLVFLYGRSLDDLQWEEAKALYYAADKYAVQLLKKKCGDILKSGLTVDNVCDALVLADRHSDLVLKKSAVDFFLDNEEVLSCPKWKSLEKSNPQLIIETMRELYLKERNK